MKKSRFPFVLKEPRNAKSAIVIELLKVRGTNSTYPNESCAQLSEMSSSSVVRCQSNKSEKADGSGRCEIATGRLTNCLERQYRLCSHLP